MALDEAGVALVARACPPALAPHGTRDIRGGWRWTVGWAAANWKDGDEQFVLRIFQEPASVAGQGQAAPEIWQEIMREVNSFCAERDQIIQAASPESSEALERTYARRATAAGESAPARIGQRQVLRAWPLGSRSVCLSWLW